MGWGRFVLLGDLGQQLDLQDRQREMDRIRDSINSQQQVDQSQDDQLRSLHEENAELKLYVTALVRLLTRKGLVSEQEVREMVESVEGSG